MTDNRPDWRVRIPFEVKVEAFRLYYMEGYTLEEIGKRFGVSRETIRQRILKVAAARRAESHRLAGDQSVADCDCLRCTDKRVGVQRVTPRRP